MKPAAMAAIAVVTLFVWATLLWAKGGRGSLAPKFPAFPTNQLFTFSAPPPKPVHPNGHLNQKPEDASPAPFGDGLPSLPSKPTPLYLDRPRAPRLLRPGVYQTYPWSMIVMVPAPGIDPGCLLNRPRHEFKTPVIRPRLRVVPIAH